MSDDEIGGELDRVLRVALTASGQLAERIARSRADADRNRHGATLDAQRDAERQLARQVEAGRLVYGGVRDPQLWEQENAQRRLGEALVAAEALRDVDPVARPAGQYIRAEARRRYGPDSDAWLAAGIQAHLDDANDQADRESAYLEATRWLAEHDPAAYAAHVADYQAIEDPTYKAHAQAALVEQVDERKKVAGDAPTPGVATNVEQQTAAEAFPVPAAEDLHGSSRRSRHGTARKAPSRERQHDRGR